MKTYPTFLAVFTALLLLFVAKNSQALIIGANSSNHPAFIQNTDPSLLAEYVNGKKEPSKVVFAFVEKIIENHELIVERIARLQKMGKTTHPLLDETGKGLITISSKEPVPGTIETHLELGIYADQTKMADLVPRIAFTIFSREESADIIIWVELENSAGAITTSINLSNEKIRLSIDPQIHPLTGKKFKALDVWAASLALMTLGADSTSYADRVPLPEMMMRFSITTPMISQDSEYLVPTIVAQAFVDLEDLDHRRAVQHNEYQRSIAGIKAGAWVLALYFSLGSLAILPIIGLLLILRRRWQRRRLGQSTA